MALRQMEAKGAEIITTEQFCEREVPPPARRRRVPANTSAKGG